ncbi:MAG: TonB-dependent receptor [Flavihumibacter sp.]
MRPKEQWFGGATIGYNHGSLHASYRLDYLNEDIYVAGKYNQNNTALDASYLTNRYTHQAQVHWSPSALFQWATSLSFQDYERQTETYLLNFLNGTKEASTEEGEWDLSTFKTYFGRSMATWKVSDKFSWQPGVEYKRDASTGERIEGRPVITDIAFFNSVEYQPAAKWLIRPGLRISHNSTYKAPPLIPSLNIKYALNSRVDLRLSYARGFRAPALRELYFNFHDANHDIVGNPNLEAEYSNSFNGSVNWQALTTGTMQISSMLSVFYNAFNNRIDLALGAGNVFTYFNISKYRTTGFSTEHRLHRKRWDAALGFSYIARYNEYRDETGYKETSGKKYAWSPELNSNISYLIPKLEVLAGFYYKYNGKLPQFRTGTDLQTNQQIIYLAETAAYHWADFTLSKTILGSLTLQAGVKNIFDVRRLQNTAMDGGGAHSTSGPVLMAYGRSGFAGIRYQFSSKQKQ